MVTHIWCHIQSTKQRTLPGHGNNGVGQSAGDTLFAKHLFFGPQRKCFALIHALHAFQSVYQLRLA